MPRPRATYLLVAGLVRPGEWTTYGDLSIAVRGDAGASRAIGRLAATLPGFPNPHRVLLAGGRIPKGWGEPDGGGPAECRRRLQGEGVRFLDHGTASPTQHVEWDELLSRRQEAEGVRGRRSSA